jgi:hypothetical protein
MVSNKSLSTLLVQFVFTFSNNKEKTANKLFKRKNNSWLALRAV